MRGGSGGGGRRELYCHRFLLVSFSYNCSPHHINTDTTNTTQHHTTPHHTTPHHKRNDAAQHNAPEHTHTLTTSHSTARHGTARHSTTQHISFFARFPISPLQRNLSAKWEHFCRGGNRRKVFLAGVAKKKQQDCGTSHSHNQQVVPSMTLFVHQGNRQLEQQVLNHPIFIPILIVLLLCPEIEPNFRSCSQPPPLVLFVDRVTVAGREAILIQQLPSPARLFRWDLREYTTFVMR